MTAAVVRYNILQSAAAVVQYQLLHAATVAVATFLYIPVRGCVSDYGHFRQVCVRLHPFLIQWEQKTDKKRAQIMGPNYTKKTSHNSFNAFL